MEHLVLLLLSFSKSSLELGSSDTISSGASSNVFAYELLCWIILSQFGADNKVAVSRLAKSYRKEIKDG